MASDAKACFSFKVEYRIIRYLYLKAKTGKEKHDELDDVYGLMHHLMLRLNSG